MRRMPVPHIGVAKFGHTKLYNLLPFHRGFPRPHYSSTYYVLSIGLKRLTEIRHTAMVSLRNTLEGGRLPRRWSPPFFLYFLRCYLRARRLFLEKFGRSWHFQASTFNSNIWPPCFDCAQWWMALWSKIDYWGCIGICHSMYSLCLCKWRSNDCQKKALNWFLATDYPTKVTGVTWSDDVMRAC